MPVLRAKVEYVMPVVLKAKVEYVMPVLRAKVDLFLTFKYYLVSL